jgi:hypothetical protein
LAYHGPGNRGTLMLNPFSGQAATTSDLLPTLHGSFMFLSFAVCMSFGIFVARYLKEFYWWFPLHWILQGLGVSLALIAFIIAIVMTDNGSHFTTVHSWFGFATLCLAFLSPILGWAADLVYDAKRTGIPFWPDKAHHYSGRLTVLVSYATIALGINLFGAPTALMVVYLSIPSLYLLIYLFLEIYLLMNANKVK